ncbi:MAG: CotH kinase family protein, partial [Verrucomicrobiae bacterium]|nr:CotH kinase family protein [Verrucomicrobiae bacterium]
MSKLMFVWKVFLACEGIGVSVFFLACSALAEELEELPAEETPGLARVSELALAMGFEEASPVEAVPGNLRIAELHSAAGLEEFIELVNTGSDQLDIGGWKFTKGIRFEFAESTALGPGETLVLARNKAAYEKAYGSSPAGEFDGKLDNDGERIVCEDAAGKAACDIDFEPFFADYGTSQLGMSLQSKWPAADPFLSANWSFAPPTPGRVPTADRRRWQWSLHDISYSPATPSEGDSVEISCTITRRIDDGTAAVPVTFNVGVNGIPFAVTEMLNVEAGKQCRAKVKLPPVAGAAAVAYRFSLAASDVGKLGEGKVSWLYIPGRNAESAEQLPHYQVWMPSENWDAMNDDARSDSLNKAMFIAGNKAYPVQVRCRGDFARSWPKKSYKIIFAGGRAFNGHERINLNSGQKDVSYLREPLAYSVYRDLGVPTSESGFARLDVNGKFWGLYIEVEQPNEEFLEKRGWKDATLYKTSTRNYRSDERDLGDEEAFSQHYEKETRRDESYSDLAEFCKGIAAPRDLKQWIAENVERDVYLGYLCGTALIQNFDCYNKNHLLARRSDGKWSALPWDLDRTLGDWENGRFTF